ncbi:zf-HC2 domain-containing protein [Streptomyces misionensis]|uniref:Zf-HC2 domain-containing protein n=1 Tax=Streptomyces misionensis TaxID=67331 RepID=A0A5C6JV61_9ACTN|nr:zf-HC2 domain-containing protein [Streptomyces misionensis]TWV46587.1 zf-HC2 domain-containing protein [Streptomyces misionensis]
MSGSRQKPVGEARLAEQHLGDRLSALVDGELGHDTRERVLAHLATCARCKAEADAQRALKSVFAAAPPPPPSASLLARLQGLPGGDPDGGGTPPPGLLGSGHEAPASGSPGVFGTRRGFSFGYVPARPHGPGPVPEDDGFRIHPVGRPDDGRAASRGLRFAFAAAGAVSLAAVALGGVTTAIPGYPAADSRGSGTGSNVVPAGTAGTAGTGGGTGAGTADAQRRRPGPLLAQGGTLLGRTTTPPTAVTAPLVPGAPAPSAGPDQGLGGRVSAPLMAGATAVSPLIRLPDKATGLPLDKWSTAPMVPGLLSDSVPDVLTTPSTSPSAPDRAR